MNIGIVTTWFERGAAYVSKQYYETLSKNNKVFIYARGGEKSGIDDPNWNFYYVTWDLKKWIYDSSEVNVVKFKDWIINNKIELVFFNEQHWWQPVLICNKIGIKTGAYIDYYTQKTIPYFKNYDFLICNTKKHYKAFDWHPQCFYIPWGADTDLFKPESFELIEKNKIIFFHSCGMSPLRKGTDLIIKAFSKIKDKKAFLLIHSQEDLNEKLPELSSFINKLIRENRLRIITETITAPGLYHLGDVYLYPSRLEGIGLTIIEALSCGLPVITSDNEPMNEFINSKFKNGIAVKINKLYSRDDGYYWPACEVDINALTDAMNFYLENIKQLPKFKKLSRDYSLKFLNWNTNAEGLNKIFNSIKKIKIINEAILNETINYDLNKLSYKKVLNNQKSIILKLFSFLARILLKFFYWEEYKKYKRNIL